MILIDAKMKELKTCVNCNAPWSKESVQEKYCLECKTIIMSMEDEVYMEQGW